MLYDRDWKMCVLPVHSVNLVRAYAADLLAHAKQPKTPKEFKAQDGYRSIVELCDQWLSENNGEHIEVCDWCYHIIVELDDASDELEEESYTRARQGIVRRWEEQGYDLASGWFHDPDGYDREYTNEWSTSQCQGCGRYPHGRRYPAMAWKRSK
jgi:hypothetical protein